MPERNQKVQDRVREELAKNPGAGTKELQEVARGVDASIGELSLRQFNAGYVLPLKRSGAGRRQGKQTGGAAKGRGRKAAASGEPRKASRPAAKQPARESSQPANERDRVRATLLEFARDFSEADSRSAIVGVLSDIDRYVDRIVGSRR
jgi:hypothetical protein